MENLLANAPKLCRLVQENKPKAKALIKNLTESELIVLIELFLNFNKIGDCTKTVEKHLKKLQKLDWKIKTAKSLLIKNLESVRKVIGLAILLIIDKQICDVF